MRKPMRPWLLGPRLKPAVVTLQVFPLPGVGAIIAGIRNPHSGLLGRGIAQTALIVFGSYPLLIPGAAGLGWAIVDAIRIGKFAESPAAWSEPTPDADPETVSQTREQKQAARNARRTEARLQREGRKAARLAAKQKDEVEDETRYNP